MVNRSKLGDKSPTAVPTCLNEVNFSISTSLVSLEDTRVEVLQATSNPTKKIEIEKKYNLSNLISLLPANITNFVSKKFVFFSPI